MSLKLAGVRFVAPGAAAFMSAVGAANKAVSGFCGSAGGASKCISGLGQIAIGALREIGALAVRGFVAAGREALRFAEQLLAAALKGSELEKTSQSLYAGLVQVTKVSLTPLTNQINDLVRKAGPGFLGVMQAATTHLGGIASKALVWGHNLITQFANGIVAGAVAVITALADIANQISYWLMPGSPPRLLPNIDAWGAGAMNAYLKGFTQADFGVFREIAGTVEGYLRSLSTGKDVGLIPSILGSRDAIAKAIAQVRASGQVTQQTLNGVFAALGPASQAMKDYVAATLKLELANKAVNDLERSLQSLTDAQQALFDEGTISQLELVAGDPGATEREKKIAALEIEKLKTGGALRTAKVEQSAAQAQFDNAKARVQIETETNNLLKEQGSLLDSLVEKVAALVDKLAKAGAAGAGLVKPMLPAFDLLAKLKEKFAGPLAELQLAWEMLWARILVVMQPAVTAWNNIVVPAWKNLVKTFTDTIPAIQTMIAKMGAFVIQMMGIVLPIVFRALGASLTILAQIWSNNHTLILQATLFVFTAVVKIVAGAVVLMALSVVAALLVIQLAFDVLNHAIEHSAAIFSGAMSTIVTAVLAPIVVVNRLLDAAKRLYEWLASHIFVFRIFIPDILIPGSPTPFETGLRGITQAIKEVNSLTIAPRVAPPASAGQIRAGTTSHSYTHAPVLNYQPNYSTPARGPAQDYAVMQTLFGGAPG